LADKPWLKVLFANLLGEKTVLFANLLGEKNTVRSLKKYGLQAKRTGP
jgi:ABC-type uncharacterized transport system permease subunit